MAVAVAATADMPLAEAHRALEANAALATVEAMMQWRERGFSLAAMVARLGQLREDLERVRQAQVQSERARERLQSLLEGLNKSAGGDDMDTVTFVFTASSDCLEARIPQCRSLVRQWSPVFELLVRHGNKMGGEYPKEVRLSGVDPADFEVAARYMLTGKLEEQQVAPLYSLEHPLLEFADQFDLREMVDDYFEVMVKARPLSMNNAGRILDLALRHNAKAMVDQAASFVAQRLQSETVSFIEMGAEAAAAVLARDDLHVGFKGAENDVLQLVLRWAKHGEQRQDEVHKLLASVRLELLSIRELTDLQGRLSSKSTFSKAARRLLRGSIREALQQKLSLPEDEDAVPQHLRKRNWTVLADKNQEEQARKMLRATLGVFGAGFPKLSKAAIQQDQENGLPTRRPCQEDKENAPPLKFARKADDMEQPLQFISPESP